MNATKYPATVPAGFTPMEDLDDIFEGKRMDGARWTIRSGWERQTNTFTVTPWTFDDEPMTAAEVREYSAALMVMASYVTRLQAELSEFEQTPPAGYVPAEGCSDYWVTPEVETAGTAIVKAWSVDDSHTIEVWVDGSYARMNPVQARIVGTDLIAAADAVQPVEGD